MTTTDRKLRGPIETQLLFDFVVTLPLALDALVVIVGNIPE